MSKVTNLLRHWDSYTSETESSTYEGCGSVLFEAIPSCSFIEDVVNVIGTVNVLKSN
jgi:hypothetical protein